MSISPDDKLPTDAELDAVLDQIEAAQDEMAKRAPKDDKAASASSEEGEGTASSDSVGEEEDPSPQNQDQAQAQARITELETEIASMKDKALRAMADADNVKKRAEREVSAAKAYGIERFAVDMLSISDNLGRALLGLHGTAREELGKNAKSLLEGIELTEKELMAVFARHGIKAVPGTGSKFDPNVHQAVAQLPSDEVDKGDVATVMQTGFTLGERTLRAAMVAVSTGPAKV